MKTTLGEHDKSGDSAGKIPSLLVDEAPYIALFGMLAICIAALCFAVRRPEYCWSAAPLLVIVAVARFVPARRAGGSGGDGE